MQVLETWRHEPRIPRGISLNLWGSFRSSRVTFTLFFELFLKKMNEKPFCLRLYKIEMGKQKHLVYSNMLFFLSKL